MKKFLLTAFVLFHFFAKANIILPAVFSDNMVLQQNDSVKFWGWANPNEEVSIQPSWTSEVYKIKASNQAEWTINIPTPKASFTNHTITITGYNQIVLNNVLIGEVWLCSGQSNMEMSAAWGIKNMDEVTKANNSNIRFFTVDKSTAQHPQNNLVANWKVCTSEVMKNSSAVAYFFAQKLQSNLSNIPIGLIVSAWGGTPIEVWTPKETIIKDTVLVAEAQKLKPAEWGPIKPGKAFNAMIHPLVGFNIAGVLWYQGESNVGSKNYDLSLKALIHSWRALWQSEFPFYFVQIAPYNDGYKHFGGVAVRNAQRNVANTTKNAGMVVISDVSTTDDIHPKDKKSVGNRLANLALKKHYKAISNLVESPQLVATIFKNKKVLLQYENAEGLYQKKNTNSQFEIAGKDKVFYPAETTIKDTTISLCSKKVKQPMYVRFAWNNAAQSNVFNKAQLPASSFYIRK